MPFIEKQDKTPRVEAKLKWREDTAQLVDAYAKWLGDSDRDYVVEQIVIKVIQNEKEFIKTFQAPAEIAPTKASKPKGVAA